MPTSVHTAQFMCITNKADEEGKKQLRWKTMRFLVFFFSAQPNKNQSIWFTFEYLFYQTYRNTFIKAPETEKNIEEKKQKI